VAGSDLDFPGASSAPVTNGGCVDPEASDLSNQVRCARCRRAPRDDADFVGWEALDQGAVCPGCLTMHEVAMRHRRDEPAAG
jgi:hypothetical protein